MAIIALIKEVLQAILMIRDVMVKMHQLEVDKWSSQGRELSLKIINAKTDNERAELAKQLSSHFGNTPS